MSEQKTLNLNIARVDKSLFTGAVLSVTVPGTEGEMTLLADHTALVSALRGGTIMIKHVDGTEENIPVQNGTLEVSQNHVTVLI
jgi:F-type H+-transporting ATPase subunit epsilon